MAARATTTRFDSSRREHAEMLLLEATEVLPADLRVRLHLEQLEPLAKPSLAQAVAYLEHVAPDSSAIARGSLEGEEEDGEDGERERRRDRDEERERADVTG